MKSGKKKLLVFHNALAPYRVDFFNALHHHYDAKFYFDHDNVQDQKFDQERIKKMCDFTANYFTKGFYLFGRAVRFGAIGAIRKYKPEIIFCNEYNPVCVFVFIYTRLFQRDIKIYTMSDDCILQSIDRKGIRKLLRNVITKNIEGVIFTSDEVSNWYHENISKKTKTIAFPIIHKEDVLRLNYEKSIPKANENISKYDLLGSKILLFVGRLVEVKNIDFLIKAVAKIKEKNFKLVIVGGGELESSFKDLVTELGLDSKVIITGRKEGEDLYSWYTFSQLFILPSIHEPYGAVTNEALVGGCYVLCSNHAGSASLINKNNGLLFDPKIEADLVSKLDLALRNQVPLTNEITQLRPSNMSITFKSITDNLFEKIQ